MERMDFSLDRRTITPCQAATMPRLTTAPVTRQLASPSHVVTALAS